MCRIIYFRRAFDYSILLVLCFIVSGCWGEGFLSIALEKPGTKLKKTCSQTIGALPIIGDIGKEAANRRLEECARRYQEEGYVVNEKESFRN